MTTHNNDSTLPCHRPIPSSAADIHALGSSGTIEKTGAIQFLESTWNVSTVQSGHPCSLWLAPNLSSMSAARGLLSETLRGHPVACSGWEPDDDLIQEYRMERFRNAIVIGDACLNEMPTLVRYHARPGGLLSKRPMVFVALVEPTQWELANLITTLGVSDLRLASHSDEINDLLVIQVQPEFRVFPKFVSN